MIDHVTIRVPDLAEGRAFYGLALSLTGFGGEPFEGGGFVEWGDFSLAEASEERPVTRRLHVGFFAESPAVVNAWWEGMTAAGHPSDGEPGQRPAYSETYYGAFVLDAAGNSVEAVSNVPRRQPGVIDHLWLRTGDLEGATRFYEAVCPAVGHAVERKEGRTQIRGDCAIFSYVEGEPTLNVHLAFAAADTATVDAFHEAGVAAGYRSNGPPASGPSTTPVTTAPSWLDPDGHNIEAVCHDRPRS